MDKDTQLCILTKLIRGTACDIISNTTVFESAQLKMMERTAPIFALIIYSTFSSGAFGEEANKNTVHISTGDVVGGTGISRDGKEYYFFKGIPFGKVEKRFANSKPADQWERPIIAIEPAVGCINSRFLDVDEGKEDCLTVDVYTPKLPSKKDDDTSLLPVMVWLYGGAFVVGATNEYGGSYFMDSPTPVVFVMINYRLGPFGYLNAGVASATGNQGSKDQVLGLKWVQENIAAFSGDKNKVTIFGESAGSISVSLLTLSPMAKGLFHRAIMMSGTAIQPFISHRLDGPALAKRLAQEFDCPTSNSEYLVTCLERIEAKEFGKWLGVVDEYGWDGTTHLMTPSIETWNGPEDEVFLSEDPYKLAVQGKFARVPMIMGFIGWESYASAMAVANSPKTTQKLNARWGRVMESMLYLANTAEDPAHVTTELKSHFLSGEDLNDENVMQFEHLLADRHWIYPVRTMASMYSKHVPVYLYNFTQQVKILGNENTDPESIALIPSSKDGKTRRPPSHGDELPYFFDMTGDMKRFYEPVCRNCEDFKLSYDIISTWTSFAKTGKPEGPFGHWSTFTDGEEGDAKILHIESPLKFAPFPKSWKKDDIFWNSLSIKEYGKKWSSYEDEKNCMR